MGLERDWVFGALRLTFGASNTPSDVDELLAVIPPLVVGARPRVAVA
jgi:cysteine sulfinate desulfinase/cysteine desulfurase-like protein